MAHAFKQLRAEHLDLANDQVESRGIVCRLSTPRNRSWDHVRPSGLRFPVESRLVGQLVRSRRSLCTCLTIVVLAAFDGCAKNQNDRPIENEPPIGWNSPRLREVEQEWQTVWDAYDKIGPASKLKYAETVMSADGILQKRLSPESQHLLAATADAVSVRFDDRSYFTNGLLAFLVKAFVAAGDRESLVGLLSKRCPSRIDGPELIEFYLAFRGRKLKDPILVLGEAFVRCQVPETRHALAASLRRALADFRIRGKDDADYVAKAMQWYENQKGNSLSVSRWWPSITCSLIPCGL